MKIDPTDPQWNDKPRKRRPKHAANSDPAVLAALALEIGTLGDLGEWPPVGALVQSFQEAAAGGGGLGRSEVDRLRFWARRWRKLRPQLRTFYREALRLVAFGVEHGTDRDLEQRALNAALWHVMEGHDLKPWAQGITYRLHEEIIGSLPGYELIPRGKRATTWKGRKN